MNNYTVRKIDGYEGSFEFKDNSLNINLTHPLKEQIYFTRITDALMPQNLKEIADQARQLYQIICHLTDDKIVVNDKDQLVLLISFGKKVRQFTISLEKADISGEQSLKKKVFQLEKRLEQQQFELKFYKQQYHLLLSNLQLKPNVQSISKLYNQSFDDIFPEKKNKLAKSQSQINQRQSIQNVSKMSRSTFEQVRSKVSSSNEISSLKCPRLHPLKQTIFSRPHKCNICRKELVNQKVFCCQACNFDVCVNCPRELSQKINFCDRNHALKYGAANIYVQRFCDKCSSSLFSTKGFSCVECDYDLCPKCY